MKRVILTAVLALGVALPSFADVTVKSKVAGKGMGGASLETTSTTYIKGNKMRTETVTGDTTRSMIFDVDAQKLYSFDSKKKEADVWDMADFGKQISANVETGGMKASVKANGQTKELLGKSAAGYDMDIEVPATMGGKDGMKMTVHMTGPMWIVKGAPGTQEYITFYKAAIDKGFIFSDPRAAQGQPGQAKAMSEMYRQLAATGGIPYETEMSIKMSGEGPMAGMMAKMGNITSTSTVQSIETTALAADMFAPPAGYKLNVKK